MAKTYEYDAFISHAVEDKIAIANDLNHALRTKQLRIWYSGQELSVGDPLIKSITDGLKKSRFGIIIVSPTYLTKIWALAELNHFLNMAEGNEKVILPVLLNITPEQLAPKLPRLADVFAVRAEKGVEEIANDLFRVITESQGKERKKSDVLRRRRWLAGIMISAILSLLFFFLWNMKSYPREPIEVAIQSRIDNFEKSAEIYLGNTSMPDSLKAFQFQEAAALFTEYDNAKSYFRNEYKLNTGLTEIRSKRNIEAALGVDLDILSPINRFGLDSVAIFVRHNAGPSGQRAERLIFRNLSPVRYRLEVKESGTDRLVATVFYANALRMIDLEMKFPRFATDTKRYVANLRGFLPAESYHFVKKGGQWELEPIR